MVKKRNGQNTKLTEHTINEVKKLAYFAFLIDMANTQLIATIIIRSGIIVENGRPAITLDMSAAKDDIAPKRQTKLSIRDSNGNKSDIRYL